LAATANPFVHHLSWSGRAALRDSPQINAHHRERMQILSRITTSDSESLRLFAFISGLFFNQVTLRSGLNATELSNALVGLCPTTKVLKTVSNILN
jgi:hypothetical protein